MDLIMPLINAVIEELIIPAVDAILNSIVVPILEELVEPLLNNILGIVMKVVGILIKILIKIAAPILIAILDVVTKVIRLVNEEILKSRPARALFGLFYYLMDLIYVVGESLINTVIRLVFALFRVGLTLTAKMSPALYVYAYKFFLAFESSPREFMENPYLLTSIYDRSYSRNDYIGGLATSTAYDSDYTLNKASTYLGFLTLSPVFANGKKPSVSSPLSYEFVDYNLPAFIPEITVLRNMFKSSYAEMTDLFGKNASGPMRAWTELLESVSTRVYEPKVTPSSVGQYMKLSDRYRKDRRFRELNKITEATAFCTQDTDIYKYNIAHTANYDTLNWLWYYDHVESPDISNFGTFIKSGKRPEVEDKRVMGMEAATDVVGNIIIHMGAALGIYGLIVLGMKNKL